MRQLGLQCPVRRRKRYNAFRGEVGKAADNLLNRQFATDPEHTKWVTDVKMVADGLRTAIDALGPEERPLPTPTRDFNTTTHSGGTRYALLASLSRCPVRARV